MTDAQAQRSGRQTSEVSNHFTESGVLPARVNQRVNRVIITMGSLGLPCVNLVLIFKRQSIVFEQLQIVETIDLDECP